VIALSFAIGLSASVGIGLYTQSDIGAIVDHALAGALAYIVSQVRHAISDLSPDVPDFYDVVFTPADSTDHDEGSV
jgi:hypothetical protein